MHVRVNCLAQEHNTMTLGPVFEPRLLDPESNMLPLGHNVSYTVTTYTDLELTREKIMFMNTCNIPVV